MGNSPKAVSSAALGAGAAGPPGVPAGIHTKAGRRRAGCVPTHESTRAPAPAPPPAPPHILLATDLDCTLTMDDRTLARQAGPIRGAVDAGTAAFNRRWASMRKERGNCVLCYSTGRSMEVYEALVAEQRARTAEAAPDGSLLLPDVLITSDGTSIHWCGDDGRLARDAAWDAALTARWDAERVRRIFREDPAVAEHGVDLPIWLNRLEDFRVSVVIEGEEGARRAEASVRRGVEACAPGIAAHVFTCTHTGGGSAGRPQFWLVATSEAGGKGRALDYVRARVGAAADRVLVAGDSGNDAPMFDSAARGGVRGVVVGNAKAELVDFAGQFEGHIFAEQCCAEAITFALDELNF